MTDDEYSRSLGVDYDIRNLETGDIGFFEEQENFERDRIRENVLSNLFDGEFSKYRSDFEDGAFISAEFSEDGVLSDRDENYDWILDITAVSSTEGQPVSQDLRDKVDGYVEELTEETDADLL